MLLMLLIHRDLRTMSGVYAFIYNESKVKYLGRTLVSKIVDLNNAIKDKLNEEELVRKQNEEEDV